MESLPLIGSTELNEKWIMPINCGPPISLYELGEIYDLEGYPIIGSDNYEMTYYEVPLDILESFIFPIYDFVYLNCSELNIYCPPIEHYLESMGVEATEESQIYQDVRNDFLHAMTLITANKITIYTQNYIDSDFLNVQCRHLLLKSLSTSYPVIICRNNLISNVYLEIFLAQNYSLQQENTNAPIIIEMPEAQSIVFKYHQYYSDYYNDTN